METKACKECGRDLPIDSFRKIRGGYSVNICKECETLIRQEKKAIKLEEMERLKNAYIAEFEGKEPCEVLQLMGRAKRWLESKGYEIVLRGSLMIKKEVKFD